MNAKKAEQATTTESSNKQAAGSEKGFWTGVKENYKGILLLAACGFTLTFSMAAGRRAGQALFSADENKVESPEDKTMKE